MCCGDNLRFLCAFWMCPLHLLYFNTLFFFFFFNDNRCPEITLTLLNDEQCLALFCSECADSERCVMGQYLEESESEGLMFIF